MVYSFAAVGAFMDNGEPKSFYASGQNFAYMLTEVVDITIAPSDCPAN